jgi:hypothetical protein
VICVTGAGDELVWEATVVAEALEEEGAGLTLELALGEVGALGGGAAVGVLVATTTEFEVGLAAAEEVGVVCWSSADVEESRAALCVLQ